MSRFFTGTTLVALWGVDLGVGNSLDAIDPGETRQGHGSGTGQAASICMSCSTRLDDHDRAARAAAIHTYLSRFTNCPLVSPGAEGALACPGWIIARPCTDCETRTSQFVPTNRSTSAGREE